MMRQFGAITSSSIRCCEVVSLSSFEERSRTKKWGTLDDNISPGILFDRKESVDNPRIWISLDP